MGYVSPDFRDHVQRLYMLPVLRQHDRSSFEIVAYSSVEVPDEWTRTISGHTDVWREVAKLNDGELAELIRDDRVDVLVDLSMHMTDNRLRTFAERPAPVQLSWLAYPGTTGVDGIDYRLTDPFLDPPGLRARRIRSARCGCRTRSGATTRTATEPVRELPALAAGHVTFGCLNNFIKVNPGVLDLWARVLTAVPSARLLMLAPSEWARNLAGETLEKAGVARERVEFVGMQIAQRLPGHLPSHRRLPGLRPLQRAHHQPGRVLDGRPGGHPGRTHHRGSAGLSQAKNLGLDELVATDAEQFVAIAAGLAAGRRPRPPRRPPPAAPRTPPAVAPDGFAAVHPRPGSGLPRSLAELLRGGRGLSARLLGT